MVYVFACVECYETRASCSQADATPSNKPLRQPDASRPPEGGPMPRGGDMPDESKATALSLDHSGWVKTKG